MTLDQYLTTLNQRLHSERATEHTYRGDLQQLLESLLPDYEITNEPKRSEVGAPDYIITRNDIAVGYIEAKDIDKSLDDKNYREQFGRYKDGLPNLIITNYHEFRLYQDGDHKTTLHLARLKDGSLVPDTTSHEQFKAFVKDFAHHVAQTVRSPKRLSELMAHKTRLLKEIFARSLKQDIADDHNRDTELQQQFHSFKELLIKDIDPDQFADLYAQTIAYGMFAARSKDPTLDSFNRQEAAELIPKTNPFLRKLFHYIAGYDLDTRLSWIIDALADIFRATDVDGILHNFGKSTRMQDPIIHFYEDFLKEYNPGLRIERGVWYTPLPVVNFIVRAVDEVLKTEFGLEAGLADKSKIDIQVDTDIQDKRTKSRKRKATKKVHRVQILDPATGTGTFLAAVVRKIHKHFHGLEGLWPSYVDQHLIPRLNGFELLMAPYAMAHLKLDLLLQETGYTDPSQYIKQRDPSARHDVHQQRFNIYLTNSLEPGIKEVPNLFMNQWLTTESQEASRIKTRTPVMVVLGNPPYSGESANKGKWIMNLMKAYKKEPGGKQKLQERNSKWINDDYVKFMRLSQHLVKKNEGGGVVAFINPHGFLDNPTFRGMRWHLLKTFDKIYTIDLHGNAKKKETAPDGGKDDNVFDIQQGVSINLLIKTGEKKKNELGQVYHYDLFGRRQGKYDFLDEKNLKDIAFEELPNVAPDYFMVPKDFELLEEYEKFLSVEHLLNINSMGIATARDSFCVKETRTELLDTLTTFLTLNVEEARNNFKLGSDAKDWTVADAQKDIRDTNFADEKITKLDYRVFDSKWTYYTGNSKGFHCRPRGNVMTHLMKPNIALNLISRSRTGEFIRPFVSTRITDKSYLSTLDNSKTFLLYLHDGKTRFPNFDQERIQKLALEINLNFLPDHDPERLRDAIQLREKGQDAYSGWDIPESVSHPDFKIQKTEFFTPLDLLDYIYAVLHSPSYRERYKEFLKTDFPRVPWPEDQENFWQLVALGGELRQYHLMEHPKSGESTVTYPAGGDNVISRKLTKTSPGFEPDIDTAGTTSTGKVWINDDQYFDKVPKTAWEFYIGGYQPAQKWLKDRRDRELTMEDIQHYRKIITALMTTDRLMREIDSINFLETITENGSG